jgi:hypothetical protein
MRARFERVALVSGMGVATLNIWTGAPLFAVWVGSRVVGDSGGLTMSAAGAVVVTLAVVCFVLVRALGWLSARYDVVTGRPPAPRQQPPWLRSMRGERPHAASEDQRLRPIEYVLVGAVMLAFLAFEIWFFFFAGSSLPNA